MCSTTVTINKSIIQDLFDFEHTPVVGTGYTIELAKLDFGVLQLVYKDGYARVVLQTNGDVLISDSQDLLGKHTFKEFIVNIED
jgi:hypothetical protein